ncbi:hypothetical protein CDL12_18694 [Handroanthus impetiginosus]|uniref:Uncharacterized protein n=1 Tax=Handroanthus impetiginosus TaxID=429701 RepID=A0A2G9GUP0_9LAMI|nr:hypothetical protein CDL12_18694 [Handroanthus impetiginosus]
MAKRVGLSCTSWIEVAPALLVFPEKPSKSPSLETITEEESEISVDEICSANTAKKE